MVKTKKDKNGSASTAPKKCTCDHPYQCSCGNRPERPSKGHKWYPEEQIWAGKGHKQKGGSGQTASKALEATTTRTGLTTIEQWQKLPSELLEEYCTKQRKPRPKFKDISDKSGSFKYRVIVCDGKNADKDQFFVPSLAVKNEEQAKEESALLALLHLTPNIPHERKLPEPYRTTWLNAIQQQSKQKSKKDAPPKETTVKSSSLSVVVSDSKPPAKTTNRGATVNTNLALADTFTSAADRRKHQQEKKRKQNERIRKHENIRMANQNHQVFMSSTIRKQIESLLRGGGTLALDDDDTVEMVDDISDLQVYIEHRLHSEGFSKRQARNSYREVSRTNQNEFAGDDEDVWDGLYEDCLQWLLVHLDEEDLPEGFDPRGRTLDVVVPAAFKKSTSNNASSAEFASLYGLSSKEGKVLIEKASKEGIAVPDLFWSTVVEAAEVSVPFQPAKAAKNAEITLEELEALDAIYGAEYQVTTLNDLTTIKIALDRGEKHLEVLIENEIYPSSPPKRILLSGKWRASNGASVHHELAKFVADLPLGEPMIFSIHSQIQELLQDDLPEFSLLQHLGETSGPINNKCTLQPTANGTATPPTINGTEPHRPKIQQRRPCVKGKNFWTLHPKDTPAAVEAPVVSETMRRTREALPAFGTRKDFLAAVERSNLTGRVLLVTGETGSGKSTQLPAYLLENDPNGAKIVVTQPRRLAATGVANRVAEERGESKPGVESVGYVVRGDSAVCIRSRLVFCTTGVLLRQLQNDGALDCIQYIVVDEVHERNLDTDILLGLLKQILPNKPHLRVILMSATLDKDRFAKYWGKTTPHVHIPGRTFPVQDFMLEDVLSLTGYIPSKKKRKSKKSAASSDDSENERARDDDVADDELGPGNKRISDIVKLIDETLLDLDHVGLLVKYLVKNKASRDDGSILVFLPGAPEINKALESIKRITVGLSIWLLPLHGGLQPQEQNRVFQRAPTGVTKVILSTNVAETSVTIPDCTVVVDTCREKQASYDPTNRMPLLLEQFAAKANLKQRRGRAGRVREGACYKMISWKTFDGLKDHADPEIQRVALDQTLLQLLFLGFEKRSGTFMNTLLDPPSQSALSAASLSLQKLQAVKSLGDGNLELTPLGAHLAGIPAPPIVGKLLVMGSVLGCRQAALAMAAGISVGRSPFLKIDRPRGKRRNDDNVDDFETEKQEQILKEREKYFKRVGNSDHALLAAVFLEWKATNGGAGARKRFCDSLGLSFPGLHEMGQLANQLDSSLKTSGFEETTESNRNANNWRIIHACAVAAMAPGQLVKVRRPATKYQETAEGAQEKDGEAREFKFFIRTDSPSARNGEEQVFIHPASANFTNGNYACPFLVFNSMVRTSKPFLRDVTECAAYSLLLFGGDLEVKASKGVIVVDNWAEFSANARIGTLIGGLRNKFDDLLAEKIQTPSLEISNANETQLIVKLIATDGLGS